MFRFRDLQVFLVIMEVRSNRPSERDLKVFTLSAMVLGWVVFEIYGNRVTCTLCIYVYIFINLSTAGG